jgi:hypothetical protein
MKRCSIVIALAIAAMLASSFADPAQSYPYGYGYDRAGGVSSGGRRTAMAYCAVFATTGCVRDGGLSGIVPTGTQLTQESSR